MGFEPFSAAATAYQPWQFQPETYGAKGNAKIGTGGTGTSGTSGFSDAGASFTSADVGKYIIINQGTGSATSATNPFVGTIAAVTSPTSVTLSGNLGANAAAAPYVYGTDDAPAINAAVAAAAAYAVANNYKAQIVFAPKLYMLGTLTQSTTFSWAPIGNPGSYQYNTHIPVPFTGQYARKLIIDFVGVGDASDPDFWGAAIPSVQGTCLVSAVFTLSQPDPTFGQMSIIGAPSASTGIGNGGLTGGSFANVLVNISGVACILPWNTGQSGFDFRFAAQANVPNGSAAAFAPVNFGAQTVGGTWMRQTNLPTNGTSVGLAMPVQNNNDNCNIGLFSAEGLAIGATMAEHFTAQRIATIYCNVGLKLDPTSSGIMHGGSIGYWSCEGCGGGLLSSSGNTTQYPLFIGKADFEAMQSYYINDNGYNFTGTMFWYDNGVSGPTAGAGIVGAARYNIINERFYQGIWAANANVGIPAPPAAPASATAQQNTSYRPAAVYVTSTAAITAIAVGPTSGTLVTITESAAIGVAVIVHVPPGWWYSVTSAGGTLTTSWNLS